MSTNDRTQTLTIGLGIVAIILAVWNVYLTIKASSTPKTTVRFLHQKKGNRTVYMPPNSVRSTNDFSGKVVLVTGGTSGIGLATAIAFAAAGAARVVVCGRTQKNWQMAQNVIQKAGIAVGVIEYVPCDVRVESQVHDLIQGIFTKYKKLDVAVNNAGVATGAPIQQQTLSGFGDAKSINYSLSTAMSPCAVGTEGAESPKCENPIFTDGIGVLYCLKHEIAMMRKYNSATNPGSIVNTASVNSIFGSAGGAVYSTAKAMVKLLTQSVAVEQAQINPPIRVNCVAPAAVYTPLITSQFPKGTSYQTINQAASAGVALSRIAQPSEIAEPILFLADDSRASYITGSMLIIDGGLTAQPLV